MTRVYLNGMDISERVIKTSIEESLTADAQIRISPVEITVSNRDSAYFRSGKSHLPPGIALSLIEVRIEMDTGTWTGVLSGIDTHQLGLAVLTAESRLAQIMSAPVTSSIMYATPAQAIAILAASAGLRTGTGLAIANAEQDGIMVNVLLTEADNISLSQAISSIAELASMRLIVSDNALDAAVRHSVAPFWRIGSRKLLPFRGTQRSGRSTGIPWRTSDPAVCQSPAGQQRGTSGRKNAARQAGSRSVTEDRPAHSGKKPCCAHGGPLWPSRERMRSTLPPEA